MDQKFIQTIVGTQGGGRLLGSKADLTEGAP